MTVMYLGPDVKSVVTRNKIFAYDPTDIKKQVAEIYPSAAALFAEEEEISEKRRQLAQDNSYLSLVYKNFEKKLGGRNGRV